MWLHPDFLQCVGFICTKETKNGVQSWVPRCTCFFVTVPFEGRNDWSFAYVVTAKHNLAKIGGKEFVIRVNSKDGVLTHLVIDKNLKWSDHPNHSDDPADVSVLHIGNVPENLDIKSIPIDAFLSREHILNGDVSVGNEVVMVGLFTELYGKKRNIPVVRVGNIAMLPDPDEKVTTKKFGPIEAYLIEARSIGGLSGSPVFFCEPEQKGNELRLGYSRIHLGGVIHGHWDVTEEEIEDVSGDLERNAQINMGMAIVTPAFKILETLMQEDLKVGRAEIQKQHAEGNAPTSD